MPPLRRGRALRSITYFRPRGRSKQSEALVFTSSRGSGAGEAGGSTRWGGALVVAGGGGLSGDDGRPRLQQHPPRRPHRHGEPPPSIPSPRTPLRQFRRVSRDFAANGGVLSGRRLRRALWLVPLRRLIVVAHWADFRVFGGVSGRFYTSFCWVEPNAW